MIKLSTLQCVINSLHSITARTVNCSALEQGGKSYYANNSLNQYSCLALLAKRRLAENPQSFLKDRTLSHTLPSRGSQKSPLLPCPALLRRPCPRIDCHRRPYASLTLSWEGLRVLRSWNFRALHSAFSTTPLLCS